jgi:predicted nuclease of predicted toxin-antitoxin system
VRWLIDECVDAALVVHLRELGHDVVFMAEVAPRATDTEVVSRAHGESRLLLTEDKDFGDLIFRQAMPAAGVILLRISPSQRLQKAPRLTAAIERFGGALFGRYTVIEESRFRWRALGPT